MVLQFTSSLVPRRRKSEKGRSKWRSVPGPITHEPNLGGGFFQNSKFIQITANMLTPLLVTLVLTTVRGDILAKTGAYVYTDGETFPLTTADWAAVPETHAARSLPAGCKCVETAGDNCKFDCTCTCDLVPNQCDANCCCDTDCTSAEVALFKTKQSYCKDTTTTILSVSKCMSTNTVLEVNPSYGLREYNPADNLDGFLCVTKDNNPTKGNFFSPVTTPQAVTVLDSSDVKRTYSFLKTRVTKDSYTQVGYVSGNRIQSIFPNVADAAKTGYAAFGGYMSLPAAGLDGKCSTQNFMKFDEPVTENKCMKSSPLGNEASIKASCEAMFGFSNVVGDGDDLYLAKAFSTELSVGVAKDATKYVPVTVGTVSFKDLATGTIQTGHSIGKNNLDDSNSKWDGATQRCVNALIGIHYRVTYTQRTSTTTDGKEVFSGGEIDSVVANLIVGNLTTSGTGSSRQLSLQQEYLVDYVQKDITVVRSRSGNPGYLDGLPVLAGNMVGNGATGVETPKTAIQQLKDGFRIPFYVDGSGACQSDSTKNFDEVDPAGEHVLFRHEFIKSCSLPMTVAQLKDACEQDPDTVVKSDFSTYGVYLNATGIPSRIGVYGNANYTNTDLTEWIATKVNKPVGKGTFSDSLMECTTLVTSMNVELLYANSGAYLNPQPKIVAVRVTFGREDIKFIANKNPASNTAATMDVILSTSVTFVHLTNEALEEYVPPAPPLLPEIPYDIFYPFLLSGGNQQSLSTFVGFAFMICATILMTLV
jgi:tectonic-1/3